MSKDIYDDFMTIIEKYGIKEDIADFHFLYNLLLDAVHLGEDLEVLRHKLVATFEDENIECFLVWDKKDLTEARKSYIIKRLEGK